uniref:Protein BIC1 n=1 Tax=Kalanchoe fedtschenkoi TaxID=63787 RepID=A0A7N0TH57_KALFE
MSTMTEHNKHADASSSSSSSASDPRVEAAAEDCGGLEGRERLKRHRVEVAGRVWIPDIWGQEDLLKDWIDCSVFDESLAPKGIMSARKALVEEGRRAARSCSSGLEVGTSC